MNTKQLDNFVIKNLPDSVKAMHQNGMDFAPSTAIIHTGFIAQEVEQAVIDCGFATDIVHIPVDSNDNYSIAYGAIVVPLVKAVQELSKKVDSLMSLSSGANLKTTNNSNGNNEQSNNETTLQIKLANNIILYQNEPNPFGENTIIRYFIPDYLTSSAYIVFYDLYGKEIKRVEIKDKGFGNINVDAKNLTGGIYSYSIMIDGIVKDTKKMVKE